MALAFLALVAVQGRPQADERYDRYRQPERVLAALGLARGQRVADIGAGSGYLTFRLLDAVGPAGRVVATDIDDKALAALRAHAPAPPNLVVRKVAADEPGLEAGAYDLVLMSFVDHYLRDRVAYLGKLRAALSDKGRLAVVNRGVFRDALVDAARRAGFAIVSEVTDLPGQFLVVFASSSRDATLPRLP